MSEEEKATSQRGEDRRNPESEAANEEERRVATADRRHENNRKYATFWLDKHFIGVEVEKVQEVFTAKPMTSVPLSPPVIAGLINLRGHIITTIDLRIRLGFEERDAEVAPMSIVVRTSGGPVSLLVDQIGDVIEVRPDLYETPPTTLSPQLRETIEGVYKLEKQLLLALNTELAADVVAA